MMIECVSFYGMHTDIVPIVAVVCIDQQQLDAANIAPSLFAGPANFNRRLEEWLLNNFYPTWNALSSAINYAQHKTVTALVLIG